MDLEKMLDSDVIVKAIRRVNNKDSNAYKVTEYYYALTGGTLDEGGVVLVTSKLVNIEKSLRKWVKDHPNEGSTIMQPEESALILIDDLRKRGFFE